MKYIKLILVVGIFMTAFTLQAKMPKNTYNCHVQTVDNEMGIAFLQADKLSVAEAEAINSTAFVTDSKTQKVSAVIQCVINGEKLSDPIAQQLLDSIPR